MDREEFTDEQLAEIDDKQADLLEIEAEWEEHEGNHVLAGLYRASVIILRERAKKRREGQK